MNFKVEKDTLRIFLEGDINSFNSEEIEKEIEKILKENTFKKIVLDLEKVHYISSAGLRIIVRIKQQYDDTTLVKTPEKVYDIFKMVGFQNMIKIEKL